jgi:hypothetical protein
MSSRAEQCSKHVEMAEATAVKIARAAADLALERLPPRTL